MNLYLFIILITILINSISSSLIFIILKRQIDEYILKNKLRQIVDKITDKGAK